MNWQPIAQQALSDCLALAQRRNVDVELICGRPPTSAPLPLAGDPNLLGLMLAQPRWTMRSATASGGRDGHHGFPGRCHRSLR
ncbi:hypothetical protein ACTMU2_30795 [Cupriavidus basilensis]